MIIYTLIILFIIFVVIKKNLWILYDFFDIISWNNPESIKVYIPENHKNTEIVKSGFEEWSKATNGNIHFDYIKNENYADIQVIFQDKFNQDQIEWYSFAAGMTKILVDENDELKIKKMKIIIVNRDNITGKYYEKETLYTTILHEIGHSLGLWKHSNNKQSIMYKAFIEEQKITQKDIERLKKIYKF